MTIREVLVSEEFLDRLDMLLADERTTTGDASSQDFLRYELPAIVDTLALDYESVTRPSGNNPAERTLTIRSVLWPLLTVHTRLDDLDRVLILWPTLHEGLDLGGT